MLPEKSIASFLDELASGAPTPGGGGAAALAAAMGAALVAMVANLTIGREAYRSVEDEMRRVLAEAGRRRTEATSLLDEDAQAFGAVSAAYKLPRSTDDEKRTRTAAIQLSLQGAAEPPLRIAESSRAVLDLCPIAAEHGNPNLVSDAAVGAHLAIAGLEGARHNVEINLKSIKDPAYVSMARARLDRTLLGAREIVERVDRIVAATGA